MRAADASGDSEASILRETRAEGEIRVDPVAHAEAPRDSDATLDSTDKADCEAEEDAVKTSVCAPIALVDGDAVSRISADWEDTSLAVGDSLAEANPDTRCAAVSMGD